MGPPLALTRLPRGEGQTTSGGRPTSDAPGAQGQGVAEALGPRSSLTLHLLALGLCRQEGPGKQSLNQTPDPQPSTDPLVLGSSCLGHPQWGGLLGHLQWHFWGPKCSGHGTEVRARASVGRSPRLYGLPGLPELQTGQLV